MPSQGEQMSCDPPLNGQGGLEGTICDGGMEWKPDPNPTYTDFEPEGAVGHVGGVGPLCAGQT